MSDLFHNNPCWNFQLDTQMFIFFNALAKDFVKGRMHLIYERSLILFHNPLFQAVDARFN